MITEDNPQIRDYSLVGAESNLAIEKGLADANWYISPVPHEEMKKLLARRNGPAIRDTLLWFGLIFGSGSIFYLAWGSWWAILPYIIYCTLYGSTSDSRWHESSHGTAFKTDWMNNVLYEISSFMVFRQSVPWRWSHTRHHSDTIIRGRDPEIAVPRPPNRFLRFLQYFAIPSTLAESRKMLLHATGRIDKEVATYVPESEYHKVFIRARIYLLIYATVIFLSIYFKSLLPLFFIGFPTFLGAWLMVIYGTTQHAGLAENVLDHRLNCRTVYMNRINRYLYWNMNYHVEHHMFPLVPYHALPKLHQLVKDDCPKPYKSIIDSYREIIPAIIRQTKDPEYYVKRELPAGAGKTSISPKTNVYIGHENKVIGDWIEVCETSDLPEGEVLQFDFRDVTYAIYHTKENHFYASEGMCTHGNMHLAKGLVIGDHIECAKHNGRFDIKDGSVKRSPVCVGLKTFELKTENGNILLKMEYNKGIEEDLYTFKVVSNKNLSTYIKELVIEPVDGQRFSFRPGEFIHLEIPAYESDLRSVDVDHPYRKEWKTKGIHRYFARNTVKTKRNYSMASNPETGQELRFNVRLALPPEGLNCSAGAGSSYVFHLKPGETVKAKGPYGDFHIQDSEREMVYIGGGAGMAPLRSHISYLFDALNTKRKVSYWYGARSLKELFYADYFEDLSAGNRNFNFHVALSEPEESDKWDSHTGFIHEICEKEFISKHKDPGNIEYYLCGPPALINACQNMLKKYNVAKEQILFDEF